MLPNFLLNVLSLLLVNSEKSHNYFLKNGHLWSEKHILIDRKSHTFLQKNTHLMYCKKHTYCQKNTQLLSEKHTPCLRKTHINCRKTHTPTYCQKKVQMSSFILRCKKIKSKIVLLKTIQIMKRKTFKSLETLDV